MTTQYVSAILWAVAVLAALAIAILSCWRWSTAMDAVPGRIDDSPTMALPSPPFRATVRVGYDRDSGQLYAWRSGVDGPPELLVVPAAIRSRIRLDAVQPAPWDDDPFDDGEDSTLDSPATGDDHDRVVVEIDTEARKGFAYLAPRPLATQPMPPDPDTDDVDPVARRFAALTTAWRVRRNKRYTPLHRYADAVRVGGRP